jgi:O-antigen/teichoic acid export membrane protein
VIRRIVQQIRGNGFFANAFYLMVSTIMLAAFGFLFWVVITKSYDPAEVGIATTLLSLSGLLALLGQAGLDTALVRFLPHTPNKNSYISSSLIVAGCISTGISGVVGCLLPLFSPDLSIMQGFGAWAAFVLFTAVTSLNAIIMAVFLAHKKARHTLALNAVLSICKIALPFMVVQGNALTIFILAGCAQAAALVYGLVWLHRRYGFRFTCKLDFDMLALVRRFSFSMFGASILNLLPPTILPLIIVANIGSAQAAFYYIAFTIATVLYTIAYASMQSVFAEGSHNQAALRSFIGKAGLLIGALLVPAALVIGILSPFLLGIFGSAYAAQSSALLRLFALAALPVATYSALGAIFKVTKNLRGILLTNSVFAVAVLGLSALWLPQYGLIAVGCAWLAGNIIASAAGTLFLLKKPQAIS